MLGISSPKSMITHATATARALLARGLCRWAAPALLLAAASCISPTLPPDDPPAPRVELGEGTAVFSGRVPESPALVLALNRSTSLVYGQRTLTGSYAFEVELSPCDAFELWYEAGTFQSTPVHFVAAERAGQPELCEAEAAAIPELPEPDAGG